MSVLIKGIEKPKGNITKVDVIFHLEEDASLMSVRESVEPIQVVEIPTPHGRLIDADAVLSQYNGFIQTAQCDYAEGLRDAAEDIKTAPTIIEAEEEE